MENNPWVEKYRPSNIDDIVQSDDIKSFMKTSISTGDISHYLFYGPPGSGKTSAALAIGRELFKEHFLSRVIEFNASNDRGISAVREKIMSVANKSAAPIICADGTTTPGFKIIILDEVDAMTDEALDALRVIIERFSNVTRFFLICNYISKIPDPIKSRCSVVHFKKISRDCMKDKLSVVANKEKVIINDEIFDSIIDVSKGDLRKAIMVLQNIKYLHDYKKIFFKKISDMNIHELKSLIFIDGESIKERHITNDDVYRISATVTAEKVDEIITNIISCKNIAQVSVYAKKIISVGYPVDTIITKINKNIIESKKITDLSKATIINYSGQILYNMNSFADEYIQLLDYMVIIYRTLKK